MRPLTTQQIDGFLAAFPAAKRDEPMVAHTYLKIGGPARLFYVAATGDEVIAAVEKSKELEMPFAVIGAGSNLLVSDDGFEGLIVQAAERVQRIDGLNVTASAGVFTGALARAAAEAGLGGFEWGVGIPGTIGGAVYGDAGCFGGEMRDVVASVEAYNIEAGEKRTYNNADCRFGYRDSRFKHEPHLILNVTLTLRQSDPSDSRRQIEEVVAKRKNTQPQGTLSAGCLFKNFEYQDESALDILRRQVDEIPEKMQKQKRITTGWLIDELGLKGTTIGKAQISPVHGNFLVNLGGARAQDVLALSSLVKMKVRDECGIMLEDEIQLLGF